MSGEVGSEANKRVLVAGASGTIGQAVARAALGDGHTVVAPLRDGAGGREALEGAQVCFGDLSDTDHIRTLMAQQRIDTVVSCIASRSGSAKDAEKVDFSANLSLLKAAEAAGVEHFILLSAICVQRPKLAFQHAKIAFERALKASAVDHTIVRPTAFFKSLSGQVDRVLTGKPFLLFGDGELTRCKPISDADLARFILDCMRKPERRGATLPIGGPGPAITLKQQGELLFEAAGREPQFRSVPVALFSMAAGALALGARFSDWFAEKAEYARIARYYATESMLLLDPVTDEYDAQATPEYGADTLGEHYRELIAQRREQTSS